MTKPESGIPEGALTDVDGWKIGGLPDNVLEEMVSQTVDRIIHHPIERGAEAEQ